MANSMDGQNSILSVVGPLAGNVASLRLVTKALLSQKPWLHDPMVVEMPWRSHQEKAMRQLLELGKGQVPGDKKLAFGVIRTDGVVNPTPPVARALDIVVEAVRAAGHVVMEWAGPAHSVINDVGLRSWVFDGGADVRAAFEQSGEPMSKQVEFFQTLGREFTGSEIARTNVELRRLRKEYLEYWNTTAEQTGTGRAVDGILCPLAPWPAARPEGYSYYGYSTFVNALDYTSVAVPVTNVDKAVDVGVEGYVAVGEQDRQAHEACKSSQVKSRVRRRGERRRRHEMR
jgi:amidase